MSQYYFFVLTVFGFLLYLVVTDSSAAAFVNLIFRLGKFEYEKRKWWLLHNPANPIVKHLMWRKALRMAKELEEEFNQKN
jgi:hypothetical protein